MGPIQLRKQPFSRSLRGRLVAWFLLLSCLPVLGALLLLNQYYAEFLQDQIITLSRQNLHSTAENCFNKSQLYFKELYALAIDPDFLEALRQTDADTAEQTRKIEQTMLSAVNRMQWGVVSMAAITDDGRLYYTRDRMGHGIADIVDAFWTIGSETFEAEAILSRTTSYSGQPVILTAVPLQEFSSGTVYGCLVIGIYAQSFDSILRFQDPSRYTGCLMASWDGTILHHAEPGRIGMSLDGYLAESRGGELYITTERLSTPDWQVLGIVYTGEVDRYTNTISLVCLGVILLFISLYVCFVLLLMKRVTASLDRLTHAMQDVHGDVFPQIDTAAPTRDIAALLTGYNVMAGKLERSRGEIRRHHQSELDALNLLREAELKALELQINPHFLYNTLHTINCLALANGDYEVSNMLKYFSDMLRYIVGDSKKLATLEEEADWLNKYLLLQQRRFDHSFTFTLEIPGDLLGVRVHKLLFQPLVENAILHGFRAGRVQKHLTLIACLDEGRLRVRIADNGSGIPEQTLREIQQLFGRIPDEDKPGLGRLGMGIVNTWYRLHMYYQRDFSITVDSEEGRGTSFTLWLPLR